MTDSPRSTTVPQPASVETNLRNPVFRLEDS